MKRDIKNLVSLHLCVICFYLCKELFILSLLLLKTKVCKTTLSWKEHKGKKQEKVKVEDAMHK